MDDNPYEPPRSSEQSKPVKRVRERAQVQVHTLLVVFGVIAIFNQFLMPQIDPPGPSFWALYVGMGLFVASAFALLARRL
jgi:hypothetical protein